MLALISMTDIFSFIDNIGTLQAILFILGLLLLTVEMFMPGFGIAGGLGLTMVIIGIILTAQTPLEAMIMVIILLVIIAAVIAVILRSAKKGKLGKTLILRSAARREAGFSTSEDYSSLIGQEGIAMTVLRPAGSGDFSGRRLDVVADGSFIEAGSRIRIIRTEGRRIIVEVVR